MHTKRWTLLPCVMAISAGFAGMPSPHASAQSQTPTNLAYDTVSIRPASQDSEGGYLEDGLNLTAPLQWFLANVYGVRPAFVEGGDKWIYTQNFTIIAKISGSQLAAYQSLDHAARLKMLKDALWSRCNIAAHVEDRKTHAYEMVMLSSGHMKAVAKDRTDGMPSNAVATAEDGKLVAYGIPMDRFASILTVIGQRELGMPIVDHTGLSGIYDFTLTWKPLEPLNVTPEDKGTDTGKQDRPDLIDALRSELGLHLRSTSVPLPHVIIDKATFPTPN